MVDHGEGEQPGGMAAQITEIDDDQQQPLSNERGKQRANAKVPNVSGVEAGDARSTLSEKKGEQNAHGSRSAIGRDENCADVEEDWMHLSKDTALGRQPQCERDYARKVESDPLGRG